MIFAAAQIWLTDHLTAKSLCGASKILERSKSFSLINHFSAPAVYNFSTEKGVCIVSCLVCYIGGKDM